MRRFTAASHRLLGIVAILALAGCNREAPAPEPEPQPAAREAPKSIFRPEFQAETEAEAKRLEPLGARVVFPQGAELTTPALAKLAEVVASKQYANGGAIVLRGHSDAGGSDAVNLRLSQQRAEAVRDWLVEQGAAEERVTVIAFGEQNPVAPNAKPDGTPDEDGRARNRRVDIAIMVAAAPPPTQDPTLAETLAEPTDETQAETPAKNIAREE